MLYVCSYNDFYNLYKCESVCGCVYFNYFLLFPFSCFIVMFEALYCPLQPSNRCYSQ